MTTKVAFCFLVALVCFAPLSWDGTTAESEPVFSATCASRYNALLSQAKTALIDHDRSRAASLLTEGKRILEECPEIQDGTERESRPILACNRINAPTPGLPPQGRPADRS